jgi:hypothetical protein
MTVKELADILASAPPETLIGAEDQDGTTCEIQFAGLTNSKKRQYFLIRANGGFPLDDVD